MQLTQEEYARYTSARTPKSPWKKNCLNAFLIGGGICTLGQLLNRYYRFIGLAQEQAGTAASMTLVLISVLLTAMGRYDDLARVGGAGTLVPITGFANAISSPAVEYRSEGVITGTCVKIFSIAGPVLVFGISASVIYGLIYWILMRL